MSNCFWIVILKIERQDRNERIFRSPFWSTRFFRSNSCETTRYGTSGECWIHRIRSKNDRDKNAIFVCDESREINAFWDISQKGTLILDVFTRHTLTEREQQSSIRRDRANAMCMSRGESTTIVTWLNLFKTVSVSHLTLASPSCKKNCHISTCKLFADLSIGNIISMILSLGGNRTECLRKEASFVCEARSWFQGVTFWREAMSRDSMTIKIDVWLLVTQGM